MQLQPQQSTQPQGSSLISIAGSFRNVGRFLHRGRVCARRSTGSRTTVATPRARRAGHQTAFLVYA
jgi:hypothetical protein